MTPNFQIPTFYTYQKEDETLKSLIDNSLQKIAHFHAHNFPEKNAEDLHISYMLVLMRDEKTRGDNIKQVINGNSKLKNKQLVASGMIVTACSYLVECIKSIRNGNIQLAWAFMADTRYWCGVLNASMGIEEARLLTISSTKKITAAQGGVARAKKRQPIIIEAQRLAREKCPVEQGWKSRRHAVSTIKKDVLNFASMKKLSLSPEQAATTIDGWLKAMHDSKSLFPQRISKKKVKLITIDSDNI